MSILSWASRRVGGLSLLALLALCYFAISSQFTRRLVDDNLTTASASTATLIFAYYSLFIHILVVIFPFRACWATWDITCTLRRMARTRRWKDSKASIRPSSSSSSSSFSNAETLTPSHTLASSATCSEAGDVESGYFADVEVDPPKNIHAILIPNYKEEVDVLRETLDVLACHPLARAEYDIYLAMEAREAGCDLKAMQLIADFVKRFRSIDFTLHPGDIPNEAPGKSSNISWAARQASERYPTRLRAEVTITVIDADSHLSANYFELINSMRLAHPDTAPTTLYSAPIIFDRNAHLVPAVVRVADILWGAAGMSGLYAGSSIRPPTSVYSLPLGLADKVGGWDTDRGAIGEDLHMYLKCFLALNGNLTTRTVLAPVSQTNVSSGKKGVRGKVQDCQARYKQALRHMWGALDSGYALRQLAEMWRDRRLTSKTYGLLHGNGNANSLYLEKPDLETDASGIFSDMTTYAVESPNYFRLFALFHRLFEAHFLPIHMAILTIASGIHDFLIVHYASPEPTYIAATFSVAAYLRIIGFLMVAAYMALYESFHGLCVAQRKSEMRSAGPALYAQSTFSSRSWARNWSDYVLIPIVAPLFGSIPASQAQLSHFWTLDLVYTVSKKPERQAVEVEKGVLEA